MSVRNTVLALIKRNGINEFTLNELRSLCKGAVNSQSTKHFNAIIYKALWVLEKKGIVEAVKDTSDKSEKFYALTEQGLRLLDTITITITLISEPPKEIVNPKNPFEKVSRLISEYSVALAEASAEAQEYQDLSLKLPNLKDYLEKKFIDAKSRAAHYKGRLTAVENLLKEKIDATSSLAG